MNDSAENDRSNSNDDLSENPSVILDQIIADVLDAEAEGGSIDEAQLLEAHPEFAEQLKRFLADHNRMGGLLDRGSDDAKTLPPSHGTRGMGGEATIDGINPRSRHNVDPDQCIDDYLLLDKIAEGGMGVVFSAKQLSLNRTVALKMIRAGEFADKEEIQRFRVEAEAAAKLSHPNIVPIYQIGEDKGQHFFSMELVEGHSLAEMIREQRMKPRRAAEYVAKVARAVHYAHEQGIIHRDIKPANVLVDTNDQPKVTDFGLAKQITSDHELTMSGQILGTASYMSPEQAAGKEVTPLADVYALGSLLYALLTQKPPFTGANPVDILLDVLSKDPASPSSMNITISRDLETICMRCLEKDPNRRYASAAEAADDLDRFLDGVPIHARPVGRIEKYVRWCKRRPAAAATIALSLLLFAAVGAYYGKNVIEQIVVVESARGKTPDLLQRARDHYKTNLPVATTPPDQLYLNAGLAMLGYSKSPNGENQRIFQELANDLEAALNSNPEDEKLQSALADTLFQLARFHFSDRKESADVVTDDDVPQVSAWLERSQGLTEKLLVKHPKNEQLKSRAAAVQAAKENLPGNFEERFAHLQAARMMSSVWDTKEGIIRFDLKQPALSEITDDELMSILKSSHTKLEAKEYLQATAGYQTALAREDMSPGALVQTFADLTRLSTHVDHAVKMTLEGEMQAGWPTTAKDFYYAILGIRVANSE